MNPDSFWPISTGSATRRTRSRALRRFVLTLPCGENSLIATLWTNLCRIFFGRFRQRRANGLTMALRSI